NPTIDTIEASDARLVVDGLARGDRFSEDRTDVRHIIWMNRTVRGHVLYRFSSLTAERHQFVVDRLEITNLRENGDRSRDRIQDQTPLVLTFAESLLCTFALGEAAEKCDALVARPF